MVCGLEMCALFLTFFEKVIFKSIGKPVRLFVFPWFAWPDSSVDRTHRLSLKKIMLTEGQFDSLQSSFIPTEENELYFSEIFLWVTV